ncbi:hypothetical protein [Halococcus sp. IIIV-5B]|uniref:hypothetical protein n=1 Tax=Halococcus sp. IIIV-5B TaxID=2321230 RepID=UPI000E755E04|nr:hypothetical protein [Halococcus sp. IIIV-5B]RJT07477.1 hypothetical protein D3261_02405 [Halococcus sp. IIIV-5B]
MIVVDLGNRGYFMTMVPEVSLGEVMDVLSVMAGDVSVHAKIDAARARGFRSTVTFRESTASPFTRPPSISIPTTRASRLTRRARRPMLVFESTSEKFVEQNLTSFVETDNVRGLPLCADNHDVIDVTERGGVEAIREDADAAGFGAVEYVARWTGSDREE